MDGPVSPDDGPVATADPVLDAHWTQKQSATKARETIGELVLAAGFVAVAIAIALADSDRVVDPWAVGAFVATYAAMASILFHVGAGYAVPTQMVLVPMLLLGPVPLVPALVAAGLVISTVPAVVRRGEPPLRLVSAVGDAWYSIAPAAVLLVAGEPGPTLANAPIFVACFAAQVAGEGVVAIAREWVTRGIHPRDQAGVLGMVHAVDLLIWPVGLLAAIAGAHAPFAWLLVLPQGVLLGLLARERGTQITVAQERLAALRHERARFLGAIRRVGAAFASTLDREALLALTLDTAHEAVAARASAIVDGGSSRIVGQDVSEEIERRLVAMAHRARARREIVVARHGQLNLVGCAVRTHSDDQPAIALAHARDGEPFDDAERDELASLAQQVAVSLENVELHARLRHQATTDSLTGLANRRTLTERLEYELDHARRDRGRLAVLLIDIDDFKVINDTYGHLEGDRVIRHVATLLADACRAGDEPARCGGEEFAILLPGAAPGDALRVAERVRASVEAAPVLTARGEIMRLTVSIGAAWIEGPEARAASLLALADERLYHAKRSGKNRVVAE